MEIIGVDLDARQQTIARLDTATGEVVEKTVEHQSENLRPHPKSQRSLPDVSGCSACRSTAILAVHSRCVSSHAVRPRYASDAALPAILYMACAWLISPCAMLQTPTRLRHPPLRPQYVKSLSSPNFKGSIKRLK